MRAHPDGQVLLVVQPTGIGRGAHDSTPAAAAAADSSNAPQSPSAAAAAAQLPRGHGDPPEEGVRVTSAAPLATNTASPGARGLITPPQPAVGAAAAGALESPQTGTQWPVRKMIDFPTRPV